MPFPSCNPAMNLTCLYILHSTVYPSENKPVGRQLLVNTELANRLFFLFHSQPGRFAYDALVP